MKAKQLQAQQYNCAITSPLGKLGLTIVDKELTKIQFLSTRAQLLAAQDSLAHQIVAKIKKYFCSPRLQFKLPIQAKGTPLQKKIWRALQKIPCGKTVTYGELAQKIGTNPRVIGNACRRNPIPIVIPCHRVVAKAGLGGYCGKTCNDFLKIKKWMLQHEHK
ncbi:Methylated-DNA--(protein)-cysteine S-methyltransferase [Gammaproteobacteria bacterium]